MKNLIKQVQIDYLLVGLSTCMVLGTLAMLANPDLSVPFLSLISWLVAPIDADPSAAIAFLNGAGYVLGLVWIVRLSAKRNATTLELYEKMSLQVEMTSQLLDQTHKLLNNITSTKQT